MKKEESIRQFIKTIVSLTKIYSLIEDRFFSEKFIEKIYTFGFDFVDLIETGNGGSVAQYQVLIERCSADLNLLENILEELRYLKIITDTPLLLNVMRDLLAIKLGILNMRKSHVIVEERKEYKEEKIQENKVINKPKKNTKINPNKKRIFEFIKSSPNIRTKDIIFEFNAISSRTVKRNLMELSREGLIKRKVDNKAVYYYTSE